MSPNILDRARAGAEAVRNPDHVHRPLPQAELVALAQKAKESVSRIGAAPTIADVASAITLTQDIGTRSNEINALGVAIKQAESQASRVFIDGVLQNEKSPDEEAGKHKLAVASSICSLGTAAQIHQTRMFESLTIIDIHLAQAQQILEIAEDVRIAKDDEELKVLKKAINKILSTNKLPDATIDKIVTIAKEYKELKSTPLTLPSETAKLSEIGDANGRNAVVELSANQSMIDIALETILRDDAKTQTMVDVIDMNDPNSVGALKTIGKYLVDKGIRSSIIENAIRQANEATNKELNELREENRILVEIARVERERAEQLEAGLTSAQVDLAERINALKNKLILRVGINATNLVKWVDRLKRRPAPAPQVGNAVNEAEQTALVEQLTEQIDGCTTIIFIENIWKNIKESNRTGKLRDDKYYGCKNLARVKGQQIYNKDTTTDKGMSALLWNLGVRPEGYQHTTKYFDILNKDKKNNKLLFDTERDQSRFNILVVKVIGGINLPAEEVNELVELSKIVKEKGEAYIAERNKSAEPLTLGQVSDPITAYGNEKIIEVKDMQGLNMVYQIINNNIVLTLPGEGDTLSIQQAGNTTKEIMLNGDKYTIEASMTDPADLAFTLKVSKKEKSSPSTPVAGDASSSTHNSETNNVQPTPYSFTQELNPTSEENIIGDEQIFFTEGDQIIETNTHQVSNSLVTWGIS